MAHEIRFLAPGVQQVFLVWAQDMWEGLPPLPYPGGSFVQCGAVHPPMAHRQGQLAAILSVLQGTHLVFVFHITRSNRTTDLWKGRGRPMRADEALARAGGVTAVAGDPVDPTRYPGPAEVWLLVLFGAVLVVMLAFLAQWAERPDRPSLSAFVAALRILVGLFLRL